MPVKFVLIKKYTEKMTQVHFTGQSAALRAQFDDIAVGILQVE